MILTEANGVWSGRSIRSDSPFRFAMKEEMAWNYSNSLLDVADLIDQRTAKWNANLVKKLYDYEVAMEIVSIPL